LLYKKFVKSCQIGTFFVYGFSMKFCPRI
jgi:hypothetical protein